ncbi:MAG: HlyD family efflux transporter periplasmic adaptor subunit [Oligoflexia bacterium]|nr:HlyD family efflux transporter periplasmic adaptor subunit [Oligoflexia bacterium]
MNTSSAGIRPSSKKRWIVVLSVLFLLLVVGVLFFSKILLWGKNQRDAIVSSISSISNSNSSGGGGGGGANFGVVVREDLVQKVTISGVIQPKRKTVIVAPYDGYVGKLLVKIGDKVRSAQPLLTIDPTLIGNKETVYPLLAPFAGTVVQIRKSEGEFVKQSDPTNYIMRIDDLGRPYILADVPEIDRARLKLGQAALIRVTGLSVGGTSEGDGSDNGSYNGKISELALAPNEKDSGGGERGGASYTVKIDILDANSKIMPGMSAISDVIIQKKDNVLTLRHEYIQKGEVVENKKNKSKENAYFVVMPNGSKRSIKLGMQNDDGAEIVEGLTEGEKVRIVDFSNQELINMD